MAKDTRAHPRVATNFQAKIRRSDGRTHTTGQILNISLGGIFIEMDEPLAFGSEFNVEFSMPGGVPIRCEGLVVWTTKTNPERAPGKRGIGVRLMKIGVAEMRQLADFIKVRLSS